MIHLSRLRVQFRRFRRIVIRRWRLHSVVPKLLRFNAYTGFVGRRLFQYIPFLLPHDKSYYGFTHMVKPGDGLFLDIGANDGISAIGFHHIHSDYRIISLEPNRSHEASLRRLLRKLKGFNYHILGAGATHEKLKLYVPFFHGVPIYTAASTSLEFVKTSMANQFKHAASSIAYQENIVDIVPVDELGLKPDIIKIDTEGHDLAVLKGMMKTIEQYRPVVMIEFNPKLFQEEKNLFKPLNYEFFAYFFKKDIFVTFDLAQQTKIFDEDVQAPNIFCIPVERVGSIPRGQ